MNSKLLCIVTSLMFTVSISIVAQGEFNQSDLTDHISHVADKTNQDYFDDHDHELWEYYLNRPHPNVNRINTYFEDAAIEFGVPAELLKVIGQIENNWTQIGPSIDRGWGIMHLVDNSYCNTLDEAATLLKVSKDVLKDDARQNIRGAAALLASYYNNTGKDKTEIENWFEAAKIFSGLINERLRTKQAIRYFNTLKKGITSRTVWNETITIDARQDLYVPEISIRKSTQAVDYPPADDEIISLCSGPDNFGLGRNSAINTWVNHWIGVGTAAGALSWFNTCPCDRSPECRGSSAHFIIANNGDIDQTVAVANTAYHAGATGYNNNGPSIGVEHEATLANPGLWNSVPMLTASTAMACYFIGIYNIPATRSLPGIREHNEMPGTNTQCAGSIPWTTWMNMFNNCANGCPPNQTITTNSTGTIVAGDYIISSGGVLAGNNATYDAGNYIELITGFDGQSGSVFEGKIGGCANRLMNSNNQFNAQVTEDKLDNILHSKTGQSN